MLRKQTPKPTLPDSPNLIFTMKIAWVLRNITCLGSLDPKGGLTALNRFFKVDEEE